MSKIRIGRKFIGFILCLIAIIVLGIFNKLDNGTATAIISLYVAYCTSNVTQKATAKEQYVTVEEPHITVEGNNER
jgi:hypothetical protein